VLMFTAAAARQYVATQLQTPLAFAELPFSQRAGTNKAHSAISAAEPCPQSSNYRISRSMLGEAPNALCKKSGRNSLAQLTDPSHGLIFMDLRCGLPT
jgi:hypothetical protein